jgi:RNA polymerase sigma-70 factor (ECF subfamily)
MNQQPQIHNLDDLYQTHAPAVYACLLRLSGDPLLAEDLTAETFYQAILGLQGFEGRSSLKTWLVRIATHLYFRQARKDGRVLSLEGLLEAGLDWEDPALGPETACLVLEESQSVHSALQTLSAADRSLLLLAARDQLSCADMATLLGISVPAVKVRLHRARQRLLAAFPDAPTEKYNKEMGHDPM